MGARQKLIRELAMMVGALFFLPSLFFAFLHYRGDYLDKKERVETDVSSKLEYLLRNLEVPVWDIAHDNVLHIVQTSLSHSYIYAVRVLDVEKHEFTYVEKSKNLNLAGLKKKSGPIIHNGGEIGEVEIYYSLAGLEREILTETVQQGLFLVFFVVVMSTMVFGVFKKRVLVRIRKLQSQAKKLSAKQFDAPFVWSNQDELDEIGLGLEEARKSLKQNIDHLEVEVKLRTSQAVSSAKLASLGEMSAGIAHEINNPLAIISGKTILLKKKLSQSIDPNKDELIQSLERIEVMTLRIVKIIEALRVFSRSDLAPQAQQDFEVNKIFDQIHELISEKLKLYEIKLEINLPSQLFMYGNEVQFSQVVINLINNSMDAVRNLPENRWIRINYDEKNSGWAQFTFQDSGLGVPKEIADKIMEPFFTTKEVGKGTGLGLSISKGIIESHDGTLSLDTNEKHTTFIIKVPSKRMKSLLSVA